MNLRVWKSYIQFFSSDYKIIKSETNDMFGIMWNIIGITPHIKIKQHTFNDMSLNKKKFKQNYEIFKWIEMKTHLSMVNSCIRKNWNSQETAKKMKCKL